MNSFVASPKPDAPVPAGPAFGDQGKAPDEPEALRTANPWGYDWAAAPRFDAGTDGALLRTLRGRLSGR